MLTYTFTEKTKEIVLRGIKTITVFHNECLQNLCYAKLGKKSKYYVIDGTMILLLFSQ